MKFLQQNYVKYGLIMSAPLIACLTWMEVSGQNKSFDKSPLIPLLIIIAQAVIWYFGIAAKKKILKNTMSFKQGFIEGLKISLVFAIVSSLIILFYYKFVNSAILLSVKEAYMMKGASDQTAIHVDMFAQFVTSIIFGSVASAIISFFLKSKKK